MGEPTSVVDLVKVCKGLGVKHTYVVDPHDLKETERLIKREVKREAPSVVIARRECALLTRKKVSPFAVDAQRCTGCKLCLRLGCPALTVVEKKARIDPLLCTGCGLCIQVCRQDAIA